MQGPGMVQSVAHSLRMCPRPVWFLPKAHVNKPGMVIHGCTLMVDLGCLLAD